MSIKQPINAMLITAAVFVAGQASAQRQQSGSRFEIEEVIVTARKIEESLQSAPLAVSVLTARELENRGAIDVTDVAAAAPNVHFQTGGATSGMTAAPTVFIRGIGQSDFNINNDPAVGMYVDGVYLGRMIGSLTDLTDLERAEVLRGPQGTLFGRNSIGGAINLISKKPDTEKTSGNILVSLGERNLRFFKGSVNGAFSDKTAARFTAFYRERDGYVNAAQYDNLKLGGEKVWGFRAAVRIAPSDSFTADITGDWSERRDPPAALVPLALGNLSLTPGEGGIHDTSTPPTAFRFNTGLILPGRSMGPPPPPPAAYISEDTTSCSQQALVHTLPACYGNYYVSGTNTVHSRWVDRDGNQITPTQSLDQGGVSVVLNWDFGSGALTATSSYRKMSAAADNDNDFTPHIIFHNINDRFEQDQFSQEIQITGTVGDRLNLVGGLYYFAEDGAQFVSLIAPLLPPAGAPPLVSSLPYFQQVERRIDNSSTAVYGQVVWNASDRVHLTGGLRYTKNRKKIDLALFRGNREDEMFASNEAFVARQASSSVDKLNFLFNVSWDINDNTMIYGQFANGFRDGGWPARFPGLPAGIPPLDTVSFGPESVDSFEFGLKGIWADGRVRLNTALFSSRYKNMQIEFNDPELNNTPNTANLGRATIRGLEVELNLLATDSLRFDLALGYLDANLKQLTAEVVSGSHNTSTTITTDNELPYTPNLQFAFGANYSINLSSGSHIDIRLDLIHTGKQFYTIENNPRNAQGAYSIVNSKVSFIPASERWEIAVGARNLGDKEYSTQSRTQGDSGSAFRTVGRLREIYAQATWRFNHN